MSGTFEVWGLDYTRGTVKARPPSLTSLRRLLALLTVLGAFVFQGRLGGLSGPLGGAELPLPFVVAGPAHPHAPSPGPGSRDPDHSGAHAHCPFCLTGVFAVEPAGEALPAGPPRRASVPGPTAADPLPAAPHRANARAPPASRSSRGASKGGGGPRVHGFPRRSPTAHRCAAPAQAWPPLRV